MLMATYRLDDNGNRMRTQAIADEDIGAVRIDTNLRELSTTY